MWYESSVSVAFMAESGEMSVLHRLDPFQPIGVDMPENAKFDVVRYAYDVSDDASVSCELTEMPEIYLVVGDVMYFADSSGYVMMRPVSGDWSKMPGQSEVSVSYELFDSSENGSMWAVNAKYYDEGEYGAFVPEEVERGISAVVAALTVLHNMHRDA